MILRRWDEGLCACCCAVLGWPSPYEDNTYEIDTKRFSPAVESGFVGEDTCEFFFYHYPGNLGIMHLVFHLLGRLQKAKKWPEVQHFEMLEASPQTGRNVDE